MYGVQRRASGEQEWEMAPSLRSENLEYGVRSIHISMKLQAKIQVFHSKARNFLYSCLKAVLGAVLNMIKVL
jgi:hypothetical protein